MANKYFDEIEKLLNNIIKENHLGDVRISWSRSHFLNNETTATLSFKNGKAINISFTKNEIEHAQSAKITQKIATKIIDTLHSSIHTGNKGPEAKPPRTH